MLEYDDGKLSEFTPSNSIISSHINFSNFVKGISQNQHEVNSTHLKCASNDNLYFERPINTLNEKKDKKNPVFNLIIVQYLFFQRIIV